MVAINVQLNTESVRSTCEHNIFVSTVASLIQNYQLRANLMDERRRHTECWWSRHGRRLHTPLCIKKAPMMDQIAVRQVLRMQFFFFLATQSATQISLMFQNERIWNSVILIQPSWTLTFKQMSGLEQWVDWRIMRWKSTDSVNDFVTWVGFKAIQTVARGERKGNMTSQATVLKLSASLYSLKIRRADTLSWATL